MKLLLIDLDDTLIILTEFKLHLFGDLSKKYSIDIAILKDIYDEVKVKDKWPEQFMNRLHNIYEISLNELMQIFESAFTLITLNKTAITYLEKFDGVKYIFSFGGKDFQMKKINKFALEKLVKGVLITLDKKDYFLTQFFKDESLELDGVLFDDVFIVDNNQGFLDKIKERQPGIKTININSVV